MAAIFRQFSFFMFRRFQTLFLTLEQARAILPNGPNRIGLLYTELYFTRPIKSKSTVFNQFLTEDYLENNQF